ncbi:MAG: shikimate kinase [Treponema sp.]|nr:shikimate kinase [Treponema sp.]MCL2236967.1 shikimate kinase [Treponema sp.]
MSNIFLTGPKHSGKTTTGKILAGLVRSSLNCACKFIDIDKLIFQRTGKSPRELFLESAEIFQKAEAEAVKSLAADNQKYVAAAGGGIIDNSDAIAALKNIDAIVVYLDVSAECAWSRIAGSPSGLPPFLQTENPMETHRVLHERRAAEYSRFADILIKAEGKTPANIAMEIKEELANRL